MIRSIKIYAAYDWMGDLIGYFPTRVRALESLSNQNDWIRTFAVNPTRQGICDLLNQVKGD